MLRRHGQSTADNQQLLTLVHGVDRKGRPVIRAYTGNSWHPVHHAYQDDVIDKHYQKAARLASSSRTIHSLYRLNDSCFDCRSQSACTSTPITRTSTRWSPSLPGSSGASTPIIPDVRGMRAVISRLRCSLAIHAGFAGTISELTFLPVIPFRLKKQPTENCPKKKCTKGQPPPRNPDEESRKDCPSCVPRSVTASLSYDTHCCQGYKGRTCSNAKKDK